MTIVMALVPFPVVFVALAVKLNVPAVVGAPVIAPVVELRFKPGGKLPPAISHVIGVVPVAASLWL
jgi:hypothetical protein